MEIRRHFKKAKTKWNKLKVIKSRVNESKSIINKVGNSHMERTKKVKKIDCCKRRASFPVL